MKVLCLSDLHLWGADLNAAFQQSRFSRFITQIIQTVDEVSPDVVVLTGDTVPPSMLNQLSDVCRLLFPAGLPVIVTLGNHEFWTRHFRGTLALLAKQKHSNKDVIFLDLVGGIELGGVNFVEVHCSLTVPCKFRKISKLMTGVDGRTGVLHVLAAWSFDHALQSSMEYRPIPRSMDTTHTLLQS